MNDLISRAAVLKCLRDFRLESGPISTAAYDIIKNMPAEPQSGVERDLLAEREGLREALRKWNCGSCGGGGTYKNKRFQAGEWIVEDVTCKVCEGHGLNPIALAALKDNQP